MIALAFVAWVTAGVARLFGVRSLLGFDPDKDCSGLGVSCGTVTGTITPWLSIGFLSLVFVIGRRIWLLHPYLKRARTAPHEIVPTAGDAVERIVGRDELCEVTLEDLRKGRVRPRLIVGGVGTGKTAVLERMAQLLASRGAVPVAIGLREAREDLDFYDIAHRRFLSHVAWRAHSTGEAERAWRTLCQDGSVVVLADGLEEALVESQTTDERDNAIRRAMVGARDRGLRVVVASRHHDPLRGVDANVTVLEPLSEEAALDYVGAPRHIEDARRLDWIIETADVAAAPLYLEITRELHRENRLQHLSPTEQEEGILNSRSADTAGLRWRLFTTWQDALVKGHLRPEVPLDAAERRWTIEHLCALATIGLLRDSIVVRYADLVQPTSKRHAPGGQDHHVATADVVFAEMRKRVEKLNHRPVDVRLAATYGSQLGVVELASDSVRFRHSLMQSYFGSLYLGPLAESLPTAVPNALVNPGRELLVALVLRSRSVADMALAAVPAQRVAGRAVKAVEAVGDGRGAASGGQSLSDAPDESMSSTRGPSSDGASDERPSGAAAGDDHEIVAVVAALRRATDTTPPSPEDAPATHETRLAKQLDMYATAFEIDSVSNVPQHYEIAATVRHRWPELASADPQVREAKQHLVSVWGDAARAISRDAIAIDSEHPEQAPGAQPCVKGYRALFKVARSEPAYDVLLAIAQAIGRGGRFAFFAIGPKLAASLSPPWGAATEAEWRQDIVSAWVAPLLVVSIADPSKREEARQLLAAAVRAVGDHAAESTDAVLPLAQEIALAQGFKHAANRRQRSPRRRAEVSAELASLALDMLKRSHYWFTQLTLIQALTLWEMPDGAHASPDDASDTADPAASVRRWLMSAGTVRKSPLSVKGAAHQHPFVLRTAELAVLALELRQPERFIWIDESGVVTRIGSRPAGHGQRRMHDLWIPPSNGWSSLHPDAQSLVADVLILQNLADRGSALGDRQENLLKAHQDILPPCLVEDRRALDVRRSMSAATAAEPGSHCLDDCPFRLCPYPPKGTTNTVEVPEAFCRTQRSRADRLGRPWKRPTAPWQALLPRDVRAFWKDMEARARR